MSVYAAAGVTEATVFEHNGATSNETASSPVPGARGPVALSGARFVVALDYFIHQYDLSAGTWSLTRGYAASAAAWTEPFGQYPLTSVRKTNRRPCPCPARSTT